MSRPLKWKTHADLAIVRSPDVGREEFLDYMTFQSNQRPLFTELFGPLLGLKEEWEEQGAGPQELDFSAFRYRYEARHGVGVKTGRLGGLPEETIEETDEHRIFPRCPGPHDEAAQGLCHPAAAAGFSGEEYAGLGEAEAALHV